MIIASMATIPGREEICEKARASLRGQASFIYWYSGPIGGRMDDARKFAVDDKDKGGSFSDNLKFKGYILICDDDLIYPPNYAETMIAAIEKYDRKAVVTLGGGCVSPPIKSYYRGGRSPKYHCLADIYDNHRVHIPITAAMAYHTDTIRFSMDDFPEQNMADIQAGMKCNALGVPIYVLKHKSSFLTYQETGDETIWDKHHNSDEVQTRLVNETEWATW